MKLLIRNFYGLPKGKRVLGLLMFVFLSFYTSISISASEVDTVQTAAIARNFAFQQSSRMGKAKVMSAGGVGVTHIQTATADGKPIYDIYNFAGHTGFVIIAADNSVQPILGYSFNGSYSLTDAKPEGLDALLSDYSDQIQSVRAMKVQPSVEVQKRWEAYSVSTDASPLMYAEVPMTSALPTAVTPLLATTWNQGCGYNGQCPIDAAGPCGRAYAGCVATCQGQVMKYWHYPKSGVGTKTYTHYKYGLLSADFGAATYNYAAMPNGTYSTEVAKLLYHIGISVSMGYSPTGSGAYMSATATSLIDNFKYSPNLVCSYKSGYTDVNWENLLKRELSQGRPLMFAGGTHAFVLDGYQSSNYFHVNWGWGSSYDGYFYLTSLNPGGSNYTSGQCALVGVDTIYHGVDLSKITDLTCGAVYNDSTNDGENFVNTYKTYYPQMTGKEKWYSVTTTMGGRLKVRLSGLNGKALKVFLLSYPSRDSLLAYGDSTVYLDGTTPRKYYIAVDGLYGDEGKFTLHLLCPTPAPDLNVVNTQIKPNYIEPYQANVQLKCRIQNMGGSLAGSSKLRFYYSTDNVLSADDKKIDSVSIGSIAASAYLDISKSITMPAVTSGARYLIFMCDADNAIPETDEGDNTASTFFTGVPIGILNCTGAIALNSGIWYHGNTATQGDSIISTYMYSKNLTGREVVHTFTAPYDGVATIQFAENLMGNLTCLMLTGCNENLLDRTFNIYSKSDTVVSNTYNVVKNQTYYLVVDGINGLSGQYTLRVTLPDSCATYQITAGSDTNRCDGSGAAYLYLPYGVGSYQWNRNGFPVINETNSYYSPTENGSYTAQVSANGCIVVTKPVTITYSPKPSGASIVALADTVICNGGAVPLSITSANGYQYQWTCDNVKLSGETTKSLSAIKSGVYRASVTNGSCSIQSNTKQVVVKQVPVNIGDTAKASSLGLKASYSFTLDNDYFDGSGHQNNIYAVNAWLTTDKTGNFNQAYYLDGKSSYMYTINKQTHPDTLTLSIWMKTNTKQGGRIIGLSNEMSERQSANSDRHIYMDNSGKLYFGVNSGGKQIISSALAYNDNLWHMVTATLSNTGMKLYVDTVLVASCATPTSGEAFLGYWKLGWDNLTDWPNKPDSAHFKGTIDEVRIYNRELSSGEITLMHHTKKLSVGTDSTVICSASGKTKIVIRNAEPNVVYQLQNHADNSNTGAPMNGSGGEITLRSDLFTSSGSLQILATNKTTACSVVLDTIVPVSVNSFVVPSVTFSSDALGDSICAGQSVSFTASPVNGGSSPAYQWKVNGNNNGIDNAVFSTNGLANNDTVQVFLTSSISCVSAPIVASQKKATKVHWVLKPEIALISSAPGDSICNGSLLSFTSESMHGGIAPHFQWYVNNVPTGTDISTQTFAGLKNKDSISVVITSSEWCTTSPTVQSNTITATVINVATPSISLSGTNTLSASVIASSYQWYLNDLLLSATGQSVDATTDGNYTVVASQDGCQSVVSDTYPYSALKTTTNQAELSFAVYPNPAKDWVLIDFSSTQSKKLTIELLNSMGQVLFYKEISNPDQSAYKIDLTSYSKGLYLIRIKSEQKVQTAKLQVE